MKKGVGFWVLSLTWGLVMTFFGAVAAVALLVTGHKPKRFRYLVYFEVGYNWGGFTMGGFCVVDKYASLSLQRHEAGHSLQNILLGPLMPFLVAIPSAVRYWYREYLVKTKKKLRGELPPYESIWFESWATRLGKKYF